MFFVWHTIIEQGSRSPLSTVIGDITCVWQRRRRRRRQQRRPRRAPHYHLRSRSHSPSISLSPSLLYARTLYALCTARSPLSALSAHCSQRCAACSLFSLAQLSVNASARTSPPPPFLLLLLLLRLLHLLLLRIPTQSDRVNSLCFSPFSLSLALFRCCCCFVPIKFI